MNNVFHRLADFTANVAIILLDLLLSVVLVKRFSLKSEQVKQEPTPATAIRGKKISLPNVDWSLSQRHLVLVLQKGCHFCNDSAPFYQQLQKSIAKRNDVQVIAALPQDEAASTEYLKSLGVTANEVRQVELSSIGVMGTP